MVTRIESRQNATLRHLARLGREKKYRQQAGELVCEGAKLLEEALDAAAPVRQILLRAETAFDPAAQALLARAEAQGARLSEAPEALFALASDVETPQGIVFSCGRPAAWQEALPDRLRGALVLDGVQDPGNLGTILRTANAFALDAVILCPGCADPTAPKVVRATMGAVFRQKIYRLALDEAIDQLKARGLPVYATALAEDSQSIGQVPLAGAAVIVGSEGHGVSPLALARCDKKIIIPMAGCAESLNAGVAASILIWEMTGRSAR